MYVKAIKSCNWIINLEIKKLRRFAGKRFDKKSFMKLLIETKLTSNVMSLFFILPEWNSMVLVLAKNEPFKYI